MKAETLVVIPRGELIDKVHSVERVKNARRVDAEKPNGGNGDFEQMLAFEQNKSNRALSLEDMPVAVNPDVMEGKMNYYNNRAMEAYFCMAFSTTDLRG